MPRRRNVKVDLAEVRELDTIGAWLIEKMTRRAASAGHRTEMTGVADNYAGLIEEVRQVNRHPATVVPAANPLLAKVGELGGAAINATRELTIFLEMLGSLFLALGQCAAPAEVAAASRRLDCAARGISKVFPTPGAAPRKILRRPRCASPALGMLSSPGIMSRRSF